MNPYVADIHSYCFISPESCKEAQGVRCKCKHLVADKTRQCGLLDKLSRFAIKRNYIVKYRYHRDKKLSEFLIKIKDTQSSVGSAHAAE
jgi:hypothetical protein